MSDRNQQPGSETITKLFESAVAVHGERVALAEGATSLSFRELDEKANGIARAAAGRMTAAGERACILSRRSLESTAAFLGLGKARAVSVRPNIDLPVAYLRAILDDTDPRLIVTAHEHDALARALCPEGTHIIYLEDCAASPEPPDSRPLPDDRIGIAYTSGTTGPPKGVIQTHRSLLAFIGSYIDRTCLEPGDRIALLHDARGTDLVSALAVGASCCFFSLEHMGFTKVAEWLVHNRITILPTIPSLLRSMVTSLSRQRDNYTLRLLRLSGDLLKREDVRAAAAVLPRDCRVLNWFGSTEIAVASGLFTLDELRDMSTITVGRVFPGLDIRFLEPETGTPTGAGPGEIVVSSRALFEGYWKRPELDAEKIFVDPDKPDRRCFRTGDTGHLDSSGRLVVLGRMDAQLKVSGYRVEPGEIEAALRSIPGIRDAVVRLVRDRGSPGPAETLVAYLVADSGKPPMVQDIRRQLAERVPRYMIPGYFSVIEEIPRLAGGKPDRARLPDVVPLTYRDYNPTTETSVS
jgi:amino acid adenylation domain-containing protein